MATESASLLDAQPVVDYSALQAGDESETKSPADVRTPLHRRADMPGDEIDTETKEEESTSLRRCGLLCTKTKEEESTSLVRCGLLWTARGAGTPTPMPTALMWRYILVWGPLPEQVKRRGTPTDASLLVINKRISLWRGFCVVAFLSLALLISAMTACKSTKVAAALGM
jgi:hypothetical protein